MKKYLIVPVCSDSRDPFVVTDPMAADFYVKNQPEYYVFMIESRGKIKVTQLDILDHNNKPVVLTS